MFNGVEKKIKYHRGTICDGWHRVVKTILKGETTIKAIRIEEMPDPSSIKEN